MKNYIKQIVIISIILVTTHRVFAGNEQRVAQAGASELLINPWARSSGLGNANIANISGVESVFGNIAGASRIHQSQVIFASTKYLEKTDITLNAFGLSQKVGDAGVISLVLSVMDFGEITRTTVAEPDGNGSTFHPVYSIIGASYSKEFSNSIYGGVTVKVVNESSTDLKGNGIAFDAGIQYITGAHDQMKIGVTMKNWGPTIKMRGDGMAIAASYDGGPTNTYEIRSAEYELPSLVSIGGSYDFILNDDHKVVAMAAFTENSFSKNNFHGALEYSFKDYFSVRGGYIYEKNRDSKDLFTGVIGGVSFEMPLKKGSEKSFGIDYSYRETFRLNGVHSIGVKINL